MKRTSQILIVVLVFSLAISLSDHIFAQPGNFESNFRGAPVQNYDVVNSFPHDAHAFTQGLVIHKGILYESTGQYGSSTLRIVNLETGDVLKQVELSRMIFGEGITIFNGNIYQLTYRSGICYIYDVETFERSGEFYYDGEGWGITHDGTHLIISNGSAELNFIDPVSYRTVKTVPVWDRDGVINGLNELEYINGEIFANVLPTDLIARIDPDTGEIKAWIYCEGLLDDTSDEIRAQVLNGIAHDSDADKLYLTGKYWPRLYEVDVIDDN
jgi:glutaminyl-peptide cyclotransferase